MSVIEKIKDEMEREREHLKSPWLVESNKNLGLGMYHDKLTKGGLSSTDRIKVLEALSDRGDRLARMALNYISDPPVQGNRFSDHRLEKAIVGWEIAEGLTFVEDYLTRRISRERYRRLISGEEPFLLNRKREYERFASALKGYHEKKTIERKERVEERLKDIKEKSHPYRDIFSKLASAVRIW